MRMRRKERWWRKGRSKEEGAREMLTMGEEINPRGGRREDDEEEDEEEGKVVKEATMKKEKLMRKRRTKEEGERGMPTMEKKGIN
ncbi:hypothetical protein COCNU_scaffold000903G000020 [Cocos nucifera]|nr:hypothetical protein [Cocos nucifera]